MKNHKSDLLEEFIRKDLRLHNLYCQIKNHPNHTRKLIVEDSLNGKKGKI